MSEIDKKTINIYNIIKDKKYYQVIEQNNIALHSSGDNIDNKYNCKLTYPYDVYELELIIKTLSTINADCIIIHTQNIYISNVIREWLEIWMKENFQFSLTKDAVYITDEKGNKKKVEEKVEGYRPNYLLLKQLLKYTHNVKVQYDKESPIMKKLIEDIK